MAFQVFHQIDQALALKPDLVMMVILSKDFRLGPDPSRVFYVVDTHLNGEGQEIVGRVLIRDLMKEQRSALLGLHESQVHDASGQ